MNNLTTFIIPTIGRPTLNQAKNSIFAQTLNMWDLIIVYDGAEEKQTLNNGYYFNGCFICELDIPKTGIQENGRSYAGKVRNFAFPLVSTPWISFLDDDDALCIYYMYWLNRYIREDPNLDCIIFSMGYADGFKYPKQYNTIISGEVGISFSVKTEFIRKHSILFENSDNEDFQFLDKIRQNNGKIKISEQMMYYVRPYTHFPE
jgi:hypothetical protein